MPAPDRFTVGVKHSGFSFNMSPVYIWTSPYLWHPCIYINSQAQYGLSTTRTVQLQPSPDSLIVLYNIVNLYIFLRFYWFPSPTGLTCSLEVAFILDSSESAKIFLFEKQKAFVLSFSTRLSMLKVAGWSLKVRMAALQYSSSVSIEHRFSAWKDLDSFHSQVSTMNYIGHGTYTTYAITNASQLLVQETPADSVRVAVLMTDGIDHPRNPDVISAAAEAKGHGIKFFTVGLSDIAQQSQNNAKLRAIASTPAQQFVQSLLNPQLEEKLFKEMVSVGFK